jgi:DNA (cytosine-5)-methyltransferase 1
MRELVVDSFAGGGGASLGIELALGRSPDIAINHDAEALAMHRANHPETRHIGHNVWKVDPHAVTEGRAVGLLWASPDCRHHSKAKGGKPVKREIRDLAWVVVRWAKQVRPRVIILENVEEFRHWGPLTMAGQPCPDRKGKTFNAWVGELRRLGYRVEFRELRACDYGAPTIRKRLFVIARRDGRPIVWPKPTHAAPGSDAVKAGFLKPWRAAAEIIDWSLPCHSIFLTREEGRAAGVNRPLAPNTMARIAKGVKRYVLDAAEPFIVPVTHAGDDRVHGLHEPMRTVTTAHRGEHAVVTPFVAGVGGRMGQSPERSVERPVQTVTAKADSVLVAPHLVSVAHGDSGGRREYPLDEPIGTVMQSNTHGVVAPYLVPRYGERSGQEPRTRSIEEPAPVVVPTANGGSLVAAHLTKFNTGSVGSSLEEPAPTVTANSFVKRPGGAPPIGVVAAFLAQHNADRPGHSALEPVSTVMADGTRQGVTAAFLAQPNTDMVGHDAREPVSTIVQKGCTQAIVEASFLTHHYTSNTGGGSGDLREPKKTVLAGGTHAAEVRAFLTKYYGSDQDPRLEEPLHTATTKHRFGLVTVDIAGEPYVVVDIGMRMLTPRELFRAHGFPDSYVITRGMDVAGNAVVLTKTAQVRMCGNSVCPPLARALAAANYSDADVHAPRPKRLASAPLFEGASA